MTRAPGAQQIVERFVAGRASAILRTSDAALAGPAMEAAVSGGFRTVEFTLTTPGALERIAEFSRRPDLIVGAGTVLTPQQARDAVAAGARFLVSPVLDLDVVALASALGVAAIPGCGTPTEFWQAHRAGAPLQKLFPAPAGGPAFVRSLLAPLPDLRIVPTNGVDAANAGEYLRAGAVAVGFTAALFDPAWLDDRAFDRIEHRAAELLRACAAA
jgi:2-dehydro-3-deoxyphosphogluconate aldolase/(4S)-4-hydroxy-2-oxoglutarate aldolase